MFGRKVFFLNPPLSIENFVLDKLREQEYEVYIIREYAVAKAVLRKFENAICFIYIDDELSYDAWFNFIKSFEYDESLKSIFLGVLSIKTKPKEQENYLMNLTLPGGFVMLDKKPEQIYEQVEGILKLNGAKGIRKCIRLDLTDTKDVNGYFSYKTFLYSFKLKDISSVGFVAITPAKMAPIFVKDSFIHNVSITMGRYSFVCTICVYKATIVNGQCVVVALFSDDTSREIIKKVHDFVYSTLELRNRVLVESLPREYTDYNIRPTISGSDKDEQEENGQTTGADKASLVLDDITDVGELDELTDEKGNQTEEQSEQAAVSDNKTTN